MSNTTSRAISWPSRHGGTTWFSAIELAALASALLLVFLTVLASPASAGKGNGGSSGGGGGSSALQACADLSGSTTTLADINTAIGADTFHNPATPTPPVSVTTAWSTSGDRAPAKPPQSSPVPQPCCSNSAPSSPPTRSSTC